MSSTPRPCAPETWHAVDAYVARHLLPPDPNLDAALASSTAAELPAIQVSPPLGRFLELLARMQQARRILEIGTLGGYSTICLARALPADGHLYTLEFDPKHAAVAAANLARAGLQDRVSVRVGLALEWLPKLEAEGAGPFDLTFIDANKDDMPHYFEWALRLSRPGSVIVADNVVRGGAVLDEDSADVAVQGVRAFHELVARTPGVRATTLQTVGCKGYDGFTLVYVD